MVQILQPRPTQGTLRQQAFSELTSQIGQGLNNFIGEFDKQTQRQQALNAEAIKTLASGGYELTPQNISTVKNQMNAQGSGGVLGMILGENNSQPQVTQGDAFAGLTKSAKTLQEERDKASKREIDDLTKLKLKKELATPSLTPGQKEIDTEFAKTYGEYMASGKSTVEKNLGKLNNAIAKIKESSKDTIPVSGRGYAVLPETLKPEKARVIMQDVQEAATASLKGILGTAYTEKEGQKVLQMSYDQSLSPEENIRKVEQTVAKIISDAKGMEDRAAYFNKYGTLMGYTPSPINLNAGAANPAPMASPTPAPMASPVANDPTLQAKQQRLMELKAKAGIK